ncbi:MAG TPA: hypothetical protein VIM92_11500 [Rhodanobacteraceae bacterium]|jgi:hypothetical protein
MPALMRKLGALARRESTRRVPGSVAKPPSDRVGSVEQSGERDDDHAGAPEARPAKGVAASRKWVIAGLR